MDKNKQKKQEFNTLNKLKISIKSKDLKTDVIKVVPNYTTKCIKDKEQLRKVTVLVSYYDILSEKKTGVIKAEALICEICKSIIFTLLQYNELKKTLNNKKIKVIEDNKKESIIRFEIISKDLGINSKTEKNNDKKIEKKITISDLTQSGYSIKRTKSFRREILEKNVIPQFGVNSTINIIETLVNQYIRRKDYKIMVEELESDLRYIKKKQYI